jgi:acetylornithine deacetylase/succinyl-diaminopimelate desuccinylase-like protein
MRESILQYIDDNLDASINELSRLCSLPSVAAKGENMEETAELVDSVIANLGFTTKIHPTSGVSVVTGELDVGAKRTLMFYDHFDVQPAEPFELWDSPPFELTKRDGRLFARGVADNKGDFVSRITAVKSYIENGIELPVNIKFVVEGEEEISSPHLPEFIKNNKDFIKADGGIWEFGGSDITGVQEAWLGLKGIVYVQLEIEKLNTDSHSSTACVLPSAPYRLIWALNSLKDKEENILIAGFYDDVKPLSEIENHAIAKIDMYENKMKNHYGIDQFLLGLEGDDLKERYYNGPTCNICGIWSGYQGLGSKTVLPARAYAKLDFRLVEDMKPNDIIAKLRKHLDIHGFTDIKIAWHEGYAAAKTPLDHPFVELVNKANKQVFGHDMVLQPTSPGSGPLYLFNEYVPMVSIGCGDYNSKVHAPNESITIENYRNSIKRIAVLIHEMGSW